MIRPRAKSPSNLDGKLTKIINVLLATMIVLLPFHAFLTVWGNSIFGHYTLLRLWKEALLLFAIVLACILLLRRVDLLKKLTSSWLARLIAAYATVSLLWGVVAYQSGDVSAKALAYGELVNLRFLAILLVAWVAGSMSGWLINNWRRLLAWPAVGVVLVGLAHWLILPYDFFKHFGYNKQTISPYETIDRDTTYIRIRSTLRGSNLLGGYMIMIISFLGAVFSKSKRKWWLVGALIASFGVLYASGSRGAWLGLLVSGATLTFLQVNSQRLRRVLAISAALVLLIGIGGVTLLRNNDFVQNTFFHVDEVSPSSISSNAAHLNASVDAAKQVVKEPLGRGVGTAGPASVYNQPGGTRFAENYFLQIGQETGWLGLVVFVAIYVLTARELLRRRQLLLSRVLLASMAGLTVMALLMHIWADDTVAYIWWALAGVALASPLRYSGKAETEQEAFDEF